MKQIDVLKEIGQIRSLMERSSKFISISGMSGVLIGIYAIVGAAVAYVTLFDFIDQTAYPGEYATSKPVLAKLVWIAVVVLCASLLTGWWMARLKARRVGQSIWNQASRSLLRAVAVPLITGGIFALIALARGEYSLIASTLLLFYGLALCAGSTITFKEVRWLGLMEIALGLLSLIWPGYGLWLWTIGFGVLHIIYGLIVHNRYEK